MGRLLHSGKHFNNNGRTMSQRPWLCAPAQPWIRPVPSPTWIRKLSLPQGGHTWLYIQRVWLHSFTCHRRIRTQRKETKRFPNILEKSLKKANSPLVQQGSLRPLGQPAQSSGTLHSFPDSFPHPPRNNQHQSGICKWCRVGSLHLSSHFFHGINLDESGNKGAYEHRGCAAMLRGLLVWRHTRRPRQQSVPHHVNGALRLDTTPERKTFQSELSFLAESCTCMSSSLSDFRALASAWTAWRPSSISFITALWSFCRPASHKQWVLVFF